MASGGISRSGRVRKKSAKLMEMEDWDAFDLNDAPSKAKKRPRSPDPLSDPPEKKVAPIKIAKASKAVSPVKARAVDGVIHLKNLQNIQESGYLNVPTAPKAVPVAQHQPLYGSGNVADDSSSSSSESSETSSDEESDSDDSMEYARPLPHIQMQQKGKKPTFQMLPQAKTVAAGNTDFEASQQARQRVGAAPARSKASAAPRPKASRPSKKTNDDPEYEEPVPKKSTKKSATPKAPAASKKAPPKEKAKPRPMTAYMLWCQEYRRKIVRDNPDLDFVSISKKLGEAWKMLPEKEKIAWRRKAKVPASKGSMLISTGRPSNTAVSTPATTSAPSTTTAPAPHGRASGGATKVATAAAAVTPATTLVSAQEDARAMASTGEGPRSLGIGPVDVAAHLKLLGESLSTIGQRLTEHEGQIAVSGSLSVLLDSTLCALGPLLCLTAVGKEMNGCSKETLTRILNNIAYVMPGL
ncbi:hypothetical protein HPB52_020314 [Rhipicephalus sanguineus]|uniref:HMG box domain-containing protein n=1 Tax=Rhipicephalus sanguineus TaxID=34632 RepID=A0A9D4PCA5_RHISA|nr:hypothetical protein HPB52_020314 [Rhipicephalus sanguineus]